METVFSGIQPSGELHLGNYLGAIRTWVDLQSKYQCFFCIVDYHAITQNYDASQLPRRTIEMATDIPGVRDRSGAVRSCSRNRRFLEHTELAWILNSVAPFGELERMTQFKDKAARQEDNINAGLFTYPVLQAADIVLYHAKHVPVGADQVQHLELAREIVRKFNARWGEALTEPQVLLSSTPKILGLDGKAKMSKSIGNTISFAESDEVIRQKLATAATDPKRARRKDPGNPDDCNIYSLHKFFSDEARLAWVREGCTTAGIGCLECKRALADNVVAHLTPIRERKAALTPERVAEILHEGGRRARAVAQKTMADVRAKIGLWS